MERHEKPKVNSVEQAEKSSSGKLGLITEILGGKMCLGMEKAEAYEDELNRLAKLPVPELEKEARKMRIERYYEGRNREMVIRKRLGLKIPEYLMAEQSGAINEVGEAIELGQETPVDKAIAEGKALLKEAFARRESLADKWDELMAIADKYGVPYDRLVRETGIEMMLFLAPDEQKIPGFASRFSRCVLHLKPKEMLPPERGGVTNAFATCRASLRRAHNLKPLTKREYGLAVSQTMEATSKTPF